MTDARFEEVPIADRPLRLRAQTADDLAVVSSLLQDAVGTAANIAWLPKKRRLVAVLNRFRWENHADGRSGSCERVQSAVTVESVLKVRGRGIGPDDKDRVFELLAVLFQPSDDCAGTLTFTLAGGAEIAAQVECLDLSMADLTRPWPARHQPNHEI